MRQYLPRAFRELSADQHGVTALEYGLLAGIVAIALVGILTQFEGSLQTLFKNVDTNMSSIGSNTSLTSGG